MTLTWISSVSPAMTLKNFNKRMSQSWTIFWDMRYCFGSFAAEEWQIEGASLHSNSSLNAKFSSPENFYWPCDIQYAVSILHVVGKEIGRGTEREATENWCNCWRPIWLEHCKLGMLQASWQSICCWHFSHCLQIEKQRGREAEKPRSRERVNWKVLQLHLRCSYRPIRLEELQAVADELSAKTSDVWKLRPYSADLTQLALIT